MSFVKVKVIQRKRLVFLCDRKLSNKKVVDAYIIGTYMDVFVKLSMEWLYLWIFRITRGWIYLKREVWKTLMIMRQNYWYQSRKDTGPKTHNSFQHRLGMWSLIIIQYIMYNFMIFLLLIIRWNINEGLIHAIVIICHPLQTYRGYWWYD